MPDDTVTSATTPSEGSASAAPPLRPRPPGWGADLPPQNRPAVPKERQPARLPGLHWTQPEQQHSHVHVLCSVERPGITPVFGTTVPPRGISGLLRSLAFRWSENDLRHWLVLLAADRVHVGEGLVGDLLRGRVPNIPAEMGMRAEWQHNPRGAVHKVGLAVGALALLYLLRRRR